MIVRKHEFMLVTSNADPAPGESTLPSCIPYLCLPSSKELWLPAIFQACYTHTTTKSEANKNSSRGLFFPQAEDIKLVLTCLLSGWL